MFTIILIFNNLFYFIFLTTPFWLFSMPITVQKVDIYEIYYRVKLYNCTIFARLKTLKSYLFYFVLIYNIRQNACFI